MRQLFLAVVWLVLWAGQAVAAPSFCTLTGSLLLPNGDPCANCNVTIRVPRAQEVGGVTFPVKTSSYTTNTNGTLPAGVQAARTLVVEITIDKTPPITVQIPDTSSADLSTLLLPPITLPTSTNINSLSSTLTVSKGGTGGPPAGDDQVLVSNSTSSATWKTLTDCNAAGEAVTYDTATNTWGCATGLGGGGSGDVTDVGDCASGACFDGTTGSTLTGASGTSLVVNTDNNIYLSFDTDNNATSTGVVIGSNASGASATPYVVVSDAATPNVTLRNATRLRFNDTSDDTNYVELVGPSGISSNFTFTLPSDDGTSNQFLQTNGSGVLTWATPSGSGNVSNTGTPANNQIAVWTDATTIEGDPKLTLSGSSLTLGDSAVDAGFTLATGLTGGTDPQIDFTNGQVDCANCRFTLTGGTKVIPDAGGGGVATRVPDRKSVV